MKKYIRPVTISDATLQQAIDFANGFKGSVVDLDNHIIEIPFSKDATKEELMEEGMLGVWFQRAGFTVSFDNKDVEYQTKGTFNPRSMTKYSGHTATLRNRLVMTATW